MSNATFFPHIDEAPESYLIRHSAENNTLLSLNRAIEGKAVAGDMAYITGVTDERLDGLFKPYTSSPMRHPVVWANNLDFKLCPECMDEKPYLREHWARGQASV